MTLLESPLVKKESEKCLCFEARSSLQSIVSFTASKNNQGIQMLEIFEDSSRQ